MTDFFSSTPWVKYARHIQLILLVVAIFIPRLASLGQQLTIDEPLWEGRGQQFIKAVATGNFDRTLVGGQPGVTTAWLAGLAHHYNSLAASQAAIGLASGLVLLLISYFLCQLLGWHAGIVSSFVLALDPFLLGHSRIVHTDALMAVFALLSLLALLAGIAPWRTHHSYQRRYIIIAAGAAALATLSKIFALFLLPLSLVIIAITFRRNVTLNFQAMGMWLCAFIITGYVAWPALWFHGDLVASYLLERGSLHTEGTRAAEFTSQPWYYLRELAFRFTVPGSLTIILGVVGLTFTKRASQGRWAASWLLVAGVVLVALMNFGADKSDRYILFSILALHVVGVWGLSSFVGCFPPPHRRWVGLILPLVMLGWLGIDVLRLHPYYLAHYNRLYPIEADHKLGWGEGLELAADWITERNPAASVISYYPRIIGYFHPGPTENITHLGDSNFDYLVLYRSMFERGEGSVESDILQQYLYHHTRRPVHTITINGLPYVWIYSRSQ